jgi:hypothetical protein
MPGIPILPGMAIDYRQQPRTGSTTTPGPIEITDSDAHMGLLFDVDPTRLTGG